MDHKSALEAIEAIRTTVPQDELAVFDAELARRYGVAAEVTGYLSVSDTVEAASLHESILNGFDTAYNSYSSLLGVANKRRASVLGSKKPEQLKAVEADTIRTDVEAVLTPHILDELQDNVDYFSVNPETHSPEASFRLVIVPEGLVEADEQAIAVDLQMQLKNQLGVNYYTPYIRPAAYNDKRTPAVTGKGYRFAFAPVHYNVPSGTASTQAEWLNDMNQVGATELQTATDAEAMQFISQLLTDKQLPKGTGLDPARYHATYFRRLDQAPHDDYGSFVRVDDRGRLILGGAYVHYDYPARALVVPKA